MACTPIFDNRGEQSAKLCVLIPVRNDKRLWALLDHLVRQPHENVHYYVCNDLQPEPFIKELPAPLKGLILHTDRPCSIAVKVNRLIEAARGEWVVVIESDTLPDARWTDDLLEIIKTADDKAIHLGGEIYEKPLNLNNVFFKKQPGLPEHNEATYFANDTAWFLACQQKGYPLIHHDRQALLYHDTLSKDTNIRFLYYAHDFALIAAKFNNSAFFRRKMLVEFYYLIRGMLNIPALLACYLFYKMKYLAKGTGAHTPR